jgi:hypothetical protein
VTWIQNDIQRIRTTSGLGIKTTSKADINPESKISRSFKVPESEGVEMKKD